jgi:hypothetical protein
MLVMIAFRTTPDWMQKRLREICGITAVSVRFWRRSALKKITNISEDHVMPSSSMQKAKVPCFSEAPVATCKTTR